MDIKISIITPNYNYGKFIGATISSVMDQNYPNIEHIIVDDGSTDNSIEIIKSYKNNYPGKIKLIEQCNQGQTKALNVALKNVTGDIIGWINSDDKYNKNIFSLINEMFVKDLTLDAVQGDIEIINERDQLIKINKYLKFNYSSGVFLGFGKMVSSNAIFWKRKLSDEIGIFDENYYYAMDSEYWSRLLLKRKIEKLNVILANFRWHNEAKTILRKERNSGHYKRAEIEDREIFYKSYLNLKVAKYIPAEYAKFFKYYYKSRRYILRLFNGHYFIRK